MSQPDLKDPKEFEAYSKHYTDLFIYQARQRLDAIRFFFVGFAVLANIMADSSQGPGTRMFIGLGAGLIALVFMRLDFRNAQIVEIDEKPLKALQDFAARRVDGGDAWRTFARCDAERRKFTSYGGLVWIIYSVAWAGSFLVAWRGFIQLFPINDCICRLVSHGSVALLLAGVGTVATLYRPKTEDEPQSGLPPQARQIKFPT